MKERPIIFSAEMVRAVLEGRKTVTRRVIKQKIEKCDYCDDTGSYPEHDPDCDGSCANCPIEIQCEFCWTNPNSIFNAIKKCPYGQIGDRLWVRETFVIESDIEYIYSKEELEKWAKDRPIKTKDGGDEWGQYHLIPHYRATEPEPNIVSESVNDYDDDRTRWSSPLYMPRWASRILLEITDVRVERIIEISDNDIICEGFNSREDFFECIIKLNRAKNPEEFLNKWCWVISFGRLEPC